MDDFTLTVYKLLNACAGGRITRQELAYELTNLSVSFLRWGS